MEFKDFTNSCSKLSQGTSMEDRTAEKDSSSNVELEYACVILNRLLTEELFLKIGVTIGESLDVRPSVSHVTDGRLSHSKL